MITEGQDQNRNTAGSFTSQSADVEFHSSCPVSACYWDVRNTGTYTLSLDGSNVSTVVVSAAPAEVQFAFGAPYVPTPGVLVRVKLNRDTGAATWSDHIQAPAFDGDWWRTRDIYYDATKYTLYSLPIKFVFDETVFPATVGQHQNRNTGSNYNTLEADVTFSVGLAISAIAWDIRNNGDYTLYWDGVQIGAATVSGAPETQTFVLSSPLYPIVGTAYRLKLTKSGAAVGWSDNGDTSFDSYFFDTLTANTYYDGSYYGLSTIPVLFSIFTGNPQTAVPVADVDAGTWLNELGTNNDLASHCSDPGAGDSVYIESPDDASGDAFEVELGPLGRPVDGTVTLSIRVREVV